MTAKQRAMRLFIRPEIWRAIKRWERKTKTARPGLWDLLTNEDLYDLALFVQAAVIDAEVSE